MNLLAYVHLRNIHDSTGAGRVTRQMIEHLLALGEDRIEILGDRADHARVIPQVGTPWNALDYHLFPRDTSLQQARWYLLKRPVAENYWPQAQVVYCPSESFVPSRRAPLAVTLHDAAIFEGHAHRTAHFSRQRIKWRLLHRRLERCAALFHTVSEFSAERLAHFFPGMKDRLRVVHNGVAPRFFAPVSEEGARALADFGLGGREFILVVGGLHYRKNADFILDAWQSVRRARPGDGPWLVVAGDNHPAYVKCARALDDPTVRLLGRVSDEALCSLYHAARVYWAPSRYEGFGMTVLEAMACGTPVVASDTSALPEVAGNAARLVRLDTAAHTAALLDLLDDGAARADLIARGRERAARFTWPLAAARLRAHLRSLL